MALSVEIVACESSSKDLPGKVASASNIGNASNDVVISDLPISNQCCSYVSAMNVSCMKPLKTREIVQLKNDDVKIIPKPRTALFQEGEDDEHIAPQIIQLGSFIFDANKNIIMKEGVLANTATMETKLIFQGNNLHNKIEEKKEPGKEAMVISYSHGLHQRADQGGFFLF